MKFIFFVVLLFAHLVSQAHMTSNDGLLHPLSGFDHIFAMVAVGIYSVQLGGVAIFVVPLSFLIAMLVGGFIGFEQYILYYTELGIALSVSLLGMAIGLKKRLSLLFAIFGVGIFGICHGYAHGEELPQAVNKIDYALGFIFTTASLHLLGALGAHFIQKLSVGESILKKLGFVTALVGVLLIFQL